MMPMFLSHGIVGVRDMGGPLEGVVALRDRAERGELAGPRVITPGPFVDGVGEAGPMFRRAVKTADATTYVDELSAAGAARATTPAAAIAAREAALRRQLVTTYDPARARALGRSLHGKAIWLVPTLVWSRNLRPTARTEDGTGLPWNLVPAATKDRWLARRKQYLTTGSEEEPSWRAPTLSTHSASPVRVEKVRIAGKEAFSR